jgi:hypothetical protein
VKPEPLAAFKAPLPPKALSPNQKAHPKAKILPTAEYKAIGRLLAQQNPLPAGAGHSLILEVLAYPAKRGMVGKQCCPADQDNGVAALKALRDGLADGWKLPDDSKVITSYDRAPRGHDTPPAGMLWIKVYPR